MNKNIVIGPRMNEPSALRMGSLHKWVRAARPGARISYHVGDLAKDRERYFKLAEGEKTPKRTYESEAVHKQALAVLQYSADGVLVLCQLPIRREDGTRGMGYHYIAVRTKKPVKEKNK